MCWLQRRKIISSCQANAECEGEYKFVRISRTGVTIIIALYSIPQCMGLKMHTRTIPTTPDYWVIGIIHCLFLDGEIPDSGSNYRTDSRVER